MSNKNCVRNIKSFEKTAGNVFKINPKIMSKYVRL